MISAIWLVHFAKLTFLWNPGHSGMPTVRTAKHLLLESTTNSVESGTYDVICQFCTVKGMVVESEVLKAQNCSVSKLSLPVHSNVILVTQKSISVHKLQRDTISMIFLQKFEFQNDIIVFPIFPASKLFRAKFIVARSGRLIIEPVIESTSS